MDRQLDWFCYHIVTEKLVTAEQCRELTRAFADAGQEPDLGTFAQAIVDNDLCTDSDRLEKLGTLAMQEADALGAPPEDVLASASMGRPKLALKKTAPVRQASEPAESALPPGFPLPADASVPGLPSISNTPPEDESGSKPRRSPAVRAMVILSNVVILWILFQFGRGFLEGAGALSPKEGGLSGQPTQAEQHEINLRMEQLDRDQQLLGKASELRTWTNDKGKTVTASLQDVSGTHAQLRKEDGTCFEVARSCLCASDQALLREAEDALKRIQEATIRIWTYSDGRTVTASLVDSSGTHVQLMTQDGASVEIPRSSLCASDQALLRKAEEAATR